MFQAALWPYISFLVYAFGSKQEVVQKIINKKLGAEEDFSR